MRKWLVLVCLLTGLFAGAQITISGTVTDRVSKQPIEFASVLLIHLPDSAVVKGTATDKKGRYTIDDVNTGEYLLRCSFVGFEKTQTVSFVLNGSSSKYNVPVIQL